MKIKISKGTDTTGIFGSPVVINGLKNGYIDRLEVRAQRQEDASFLCLIVNSGGLIINELILKGWNIKEWQEQAPSGLLVAPDSPGVVIRSISCKFVHIGSRLEAEGCRIESGTVKTFSGDGIQLCNDDCIVEDVECSLSWPAFGSKYHRDVVQLFRKGGGVLRGCVVSGVKYRHTSQAEPPQGILASDSAIRDCIVKDCDLQGVHDSHGISFLLDAKGCKIINNKTNGLIRLPQNNLITGNKARVIFYVPYLTKRVDFMTKKIEVTGSAIAAVSAELGIQPAKVRALIRVEDGDIDRLLFERHIFYGFLTKSGANISALLESNPAVSEIINPVPYKSKRGMVGADYYGKYENSQQRLQWASTIDQEAAYKSVSVGYFQIMGHWYDKCGYSSAYEFVTELINDADKQVKAFGVVIREMGVDDELRRDDFAGFARRYVGKNYKRGTKTRADDYDWKLAKFYRQELAKDLPTKPRRKSKTMRSVVAGTVTTAATVPVMSDLVLDGDAVKNLLDTITSNADKLHDVSASIEQLNGKIDAMAWLPWLVVGFGLTTVALLVVIAYAYLTDNGYIEPFDSLRELKQ